jgi:hypothetical protein
MPIWQLLADLATLQLSRGRPLVDGDQLRHDADGRSVVLRARQLSAAYPLGAATELDRKFGPLASPGGHLH